MDTVHWPAVAILPPYIYIYIYTHTHTRAHTHTHIYIFIYGPNSSFGIAAVIYICVCVCVCVCVCGREGPGSSVGIATELGAGRSGIESRWGQDFPPVQTGPGAHPASCKMGTGSFPEVKCGRGVLTTHPFLVPRSWNSRAISLPTLWAKPGL